MMKTPPPQSDDGPSSLALAGQWGMTLAILTTAGALGAYWIGEQTHQSGLKVILVLVGIVGGFSLGVMHMLKVTDRYVNAPSSSSKSSSVAQESPASKKIGTDIEETPDAKSDRTAD